MFLCSHIFSTSSPTPQASASLSIPSSRMRVLSTSKQTAVARSRTSGIERAVISLLSLSWKPCCRLSGRLYHLDERRRPESAGALYTRSTCLFPPTWLACSISIRFYQITAIVYQASEATLRPFLGFSNKFRILFEF